MTLDRDRSPIDQAWIQQYVDVLLKLAGEMTEDSLMKDVILRRAEYCMDLLEAWQVRNIPIDQREEARRSAQ